MNGWIKLHRKTLENKIFKNDPNAWHIFEYLLLKVDHKTGSWDTGRFVIAECLKMNPSTVYASLTRLRFAKMITQASNNRFTTISICNWKKYQSSNDNEDNNQITTGQQPDNTKQEVKNKEEYSNNTIKIAEIIGVSPTKGLEKYLNSLYPNYLFKEMTIKMVQWCEEKKLQPSISRWMNWARKGVKEGTVNNKTGLGIE